MSALSASHSRAADSTSVSSTVCRSKVERLMTLSTSAVAVCCCSDFAQLVEQTRVLDGDHGLSGEIRDQLDLLVAERADLLAVDGDDADQLVVLEHRDREQGADAGDLDRGDRQWVAIEIGSAFAHVGDLHGLPGLRDAVHGASGPGTDQGSAPPLLDKAGGNGRAAPRRESRLLRAAT